ncbi:hypothetical protein KDW_30900 [Dictyobacter vulcani]|uniref:Uncharacterized protein n=1 Tax=Dictyobacter vulcani TaxID=2607529 RepID=A0A5J4KGW2_9CHLR|nr:ROK family protein [Dictyobacter vulcani]GER88928.1 hypothetical protein KDW_30900 [Dictyobacter vulcani]
MHYSIGVDVGGTQTRVGLVDSNSNLVGYQQCQTQLHFTACEVRTIATKNHGLIVFPTPTLKRYPSYSVETLQHILVEYIIQAVKQLQKDNPSVVISSGVVSFAGLVKDNAVITKAADLYFTWGRWGETDISDSFFLKQQLENKKPEMTWFIVNDVIAAAFRYARLYPQVQTLALVTISTGVGYALFNRSASAFGEKDLVSLGHRTVDLSSEALDCDCGGKGHLTAYFSGKAVETRVRERASHDLHKFAHSSLCGVLRERFSSMSLEEKKEQLQSAASVSLIHKNADLSDREMTTFLQKTSLSIQDLQKNKNELFLLATMITNREIAIAINNKDAFVMDYINEMMEKFSPQFQEILNRGPKKIVIMGGFVLSIQKVFLEMLITHISKGSEDKQAQTYLQKNVEWALGDDLDGVIGSVCAKQQFDKKLQGEVTRSIDTRGSTVFEMQACTEKYTSYIRTCNVFEPSNITLQNILTRRSEGTPKVMVVTDSHLSFRLEEKMRGYFQTSALSFSHYKIACTADISMRDVEALLLAAKTFKLGRKDYFLTIGSRATLHCGGLAAAIYRRGIPHIFIPLDDRLEDLATSRNTVDMDAQETKASVSNYHLPSFIVLDETLVQRYSPQILPTIKTTLLKDHYRVVFAHHLFDLDNTTLSSYVPGNAAFVVISEAADIIYGEKIKRYLNVNKIYYRYYVYAGGENNKYFTQVLALVRQILMGYDPKEMLICIGGGVTMDLAGFAAALTEKPYIRIPTTLLGVIDAGIGVKVGCNYQGTKNFLGDFYAPLVCLNDVTFLQTVSPRNMRAGLAEVLKMGIVREPKIVKIIEDYHNRLMPERLQTGRYASALLELATYWMLKELHTNLHEDKTLKRLVDFGHTFSPCLEMNSGHRILHGEAVAIDMAICAQLAFLQGYCTEETRNRIIHVLMAVGLPIFDEACDAESLFKSITDIRLARGNNLHLPIPARVGKMVFIEHISFDVLKKTLEYLKSTDLNNKKFKSDIQTTGQQYDIAHHCVLV